MPVIKELWQAFKFSLGMQVVVVWINEVDNYIHFLLFQIHYGLFLFFQNHDVDSNP